MSTFQLHSTYVDSRKGIINEDVQLPILFRSDLFKQTCNVISITMVAIDCYAFTAAACYL